MRTYCGRLNAVLMRKIAMSVITVHIFSGCAVTESGAFTELAHDVLNLLREYDDALRGMVYQYCIAQKQFLKG